MSSGISESRPARLIAAAATTFLFWTAYASGKGVTVSPSSIFAVVAPGGELSCEIVLTPSSLSPTRVTASVDAFTLDLDGAPQRGPAVSNAARTARLSIEPRTVTLENGKPKTISVRWAVDAAARGSFWAVVLFEVEPVRQTDEEGHSVNVVARLAVPVFVTVEGASHPDLRIREFRAIPTPDGSVEVEAILENVGDSVVRPSGAWALEEDTERGPVEVASSELKDVVVLPGVPRRLWATLVGPEIGGGPRFGVLALRYGPEKGQTISARAAVAASAGR